MEGKMMDAISRSAVLKEIDWAIDLAMDDEMHHAMCTLGERFKELPALDAVPVVRCKDCVHFAPLEGYASRKFEIGLNCKAFRGDNGYGIANLSLTVPDGYCDDGLRRSVVHD